jgi:hypothetical protein
MLVYKNHPKYTSGEFTRVLKCKNKIDTCLWL